MLDINPLLRDTATPPIPLAQGWARGYDGRAGALIDLSQAVPGYPAHADLLTRLGAEAAKASTTSYGPINGDKVLREAYAAHVSELYGETIDTGEVAITSGCNQAFFIAAMAVAKAGDAILLPAPWYFNHKMTLDMLGIEARPLVCRPEDAFVPDVRAAEALIDARTRAIVLVTPNNPTGSVYPPEVIASFADLCARRGLTLILDETYRDFTEGAPHTLFSEPELRAHTMALYSFSKSYCIPGHRLGAIIAPQVALDEVGKILDTLQICPPRVAQAPVAWAIPNLAAWREHNRTEIQHRADAFRAALANVPGWKADSVGSYFAFLRHPFEGRSATDITRDLVLEAGVLALPGEWFGPAQERHMRVAFANVDIEALKALTERFSRFRP